MSPKDYKKRQFIHIAFFFFFTLLKLLFPSNSFAQIHISGDVNGTLIDTVYIVTDDIVVSSSLNILPGARLLFNQGTHFQINGNLQANGTEQDSIYFVLNDGATSWGGLDFGQWSGYGHHLHYCVISGSNSSGVTLEETTISLSITNCLFTNNSASRYGGGIYASFTHINNLDSCTFINNGDYALHLDGCFILDSLITHLYIDGNEGGILNDCINLTFDDCIIINNNSPIAGGGFRDEGGSNTIKNSLIAYNTSASSGGGIRAEIALTVDKCTIVQNNSEGYGGGISTGGFITIKNTIIAYNTGIYGLYGDWITNEDDIISHNLFYENELTDIYRIDPDEIELFEPDSININGDPCDSYSNIYLDPQFVDYLTDFHLSDSSPCINAGDPNSPTDPDGTITDIGLFSNYSSAISETTNELYSHFDFKVFPNPANSHVSIMLQDINTNSLKVHCYNLLGQLLYSDAISKTEKGKTINLENFATGTYVIELKSKNRTSFKRLLIVK